MTFYVYILESKVDGSFYIGQTSNVEERLVKHNRGYNKSTKNKRPWKLIFSKHFNTQPEAVKEELRLKRFKKRTSILKYINQED